MGMKYLGIGFLPNAPARDLTDSEADAFGRTELLNSGLYVEITTAKNATIRPENKMLDPKTSGMENKNG